MSDPPNATADVGGRPVGTDAEPYDQVPRWLRELGINAYCTYAALVSYNGERGCFPSHAALAERAMMSERSVRTALRVLEEAGAIESTQRHRRNGQRRSNGYYLTAASKAARAEALSQRHEVPVGQRQDVPGMNENEVDLEREPLSGAIAPDADTSSPSIPDEPQPPSARTRTSAREADADVTAICLAMQNHVTNLTGREPTITLDWRRHARLMLDTDGVTLDVALRAIKWLSSSGRNAVFWSANVLSVPTLRSRIPRLHVAAQEDRQARAGSHGQALDHVARARQMLADRQAGA